MTYPQIFPEGSEAALALDTLESGWHADHSVAVGMFTNPALGVVTHEALRALQDEGLARYSTEGGYALLTTTGKAILGLRP